MEGIEVGKEKSGKNVRKGCGVDVWGARAAGKWMLLGREKGR